MSPDRRVHIMTTGGMVLASDTAQSIVLDLKTADEMLHFEQNVIVPTFLILEISYGVKKKKGNEKF